MLAPLFALLCVQLLFGGLPVASKFVLSHAHPFFVVVLRSAFATLFFLLLSLLFDRKQRSPDDFETVLSRATHLRLVVLAFFGITFNQLALFVALPQTSASITSIITPTIALFTLLFSVWSGREKFQSLTLIAILLGGFGVASVLSSGSFSAARISTTAHSGAHWANALNVMSAASYAFYLSQVGYLPTRLGSFRFSFWLFFYGFLMNSAAWCGLWLGRTFGWWSLPDSLLLKSEVHALPSSFWIGLGFLLLGATALTYFLNTWALQRVKPSLVGGFVCLQTLFGLFLSGVFLQETLTPLMIFGSIFILSGVLLLTLASTENRFVKKFPRQLQMTSAPENTQRSLP
ncbi:DMT family transporter [bacterium]|nr:DMT family transporter [bacterium]